MAGLVAVEGTKTSSFCSLSVGTLRRWGVLTLTRVRSWDGGGWVGG